MSIIDNGDGTCSREGLPQAALDALRPYTATNVKRDYAAGFARTAREAAIQQAVDDYLLMERKARAWDEMRAEALRWAKGHDRELVLELMDKLVHPAQP